MILYTDNKFYLTFGDLKLPLIDSESYPFGLIQLAQGNIGLAKSIMNPILQHIPEESRKLYIPSDTGISAFEKTAIQTCFQQLQPISDIAMIFSDTLSLCEDISAKFLGTSIKVLGKQIGIPSRKPTAYDKSKNYTRTINDKKKDIAEANNIVSNITSNIDVKVLKSDISPSSDSEYEYPERIYVAYYDKKGESIVPPKWVESKWFKIDDNIKAPFKNLSKDVNLGTQQLRDTYNIVLDINKNSLEKALRDARNEDKAYITSMYSDISNTLLNSIDGSNGSVPEILKEYITKSRSSQLRQLYYTSLDNTSQLLVDKSGNPVAPYVFIPSINVNYKNINYNVEQPLVLSSNIGTSKVKGNIYYNTANNSNKNYIKSNDISDNMNDPLTHFSNNINDVYVPDNIKDYFVPIVWEEITEYDLILNDKVIGTEKEIVARKLDIEKDYVLRIIKVVNMPTIKNNLYNDILQNYFVKIESKKLTFFKKTKSTKSLISVIQPGVNIDASITIQGNITGNVLINDTIYQLDKYQKTINRDISQNIISIKYFIYTNLSTGSYMIDNIEFYVPNTNVLVISGLGNNNDNIYNITRKDDISVYTDYSVSNKYLNKIYDKSSVNIYDISSDERYETNNIYKENIPFNNIDNLEGTINYVDKRYLNRDNPHFFLIEAIRKDSPVLAEYNKNKDLNSGNNGKDFYGLLDKFDVLYDISSKLMPIISAKMMPVIVNTLVKLRDPKELLKAFTVNGETPLTKNYKPLTTKSKEEAKKVKKKSKRSNTNDYYDGPQKDPKAEPIMSYDGSASLEDFNLDISLNKGEIGSEKMDTTQPFIQFILQTIQIPIKILKEVFEFLSDFIKKLLNPTTLISAIEEFLTFAWLKKILSSANIALMTGYDISAIKNSLNKILNSQNISELDVYNVRKTMSGQSIDYFEVFIYNLIQNGVVIGTDTEKKPVYKKTSDIDSKLLSPINVNDLKLPIDMPIYPAYMLPYIKDNIQKQVFSQLSLIQSMMNAIVNIPTSIFGIELPKIEIV